MGNVLATVLDRKTGYGAANGEYAGFRADIASATDYYPFGMEMPGRTIDNNTYRFGFNTQEKTDEIVGKGNHNTAEFWEYDTRLGRRWNRDPVVKPWESSYAAYCNNPIYFIDPNGQDGIVSGSGTDTDPLVIKAEYHTANLSSDEKTAFQEAINSYNNRGTSWVVGTEEGDIHVRFELKVVNHDNTDEENISKIASVSLYDPSGKSYRYGNYVMNGDTENENMFGYSNGVNVIIDKNKINGYIKKYPSKTTDGKSNPQGDKTNYSKILISSFIHEIAHTLGAIHGDPGQAMNYHVANEAPDSRSNTGAIASVRSSEVEVKGGYKMGVISIVDVNSIRAIIGRIGLTSKDDVSNSKYLDKKEMKGIKGEWKGKYGNLLKDTGKLEK